MKMFNFNNSITVSKELFLITQEHLCYFLKKKKKKNPNNGENTQVNDVFHTALGLSAFLLNVQLNTVTRSNTKCNLD